MNIETAQKGWKRIGWLLMLLMVLSYPIRYTQQITLGRVVLYTGLIRISLFMLIFAYAVWIASQERSRQQFRIVTIGYVLVSVFIYNLIIVDYGVFYTAFAFNFFCIPPTIALIFLLNSEYFPARTERDELRLIHLLLVVAVPIALFGIVQYLLNDPILQTNFEQNAGDAYGSAGQAGIRLTELAAIHRVRANSIFDSALDFGNFSTVFALICLGMTVKERRRPKAALGYAVLTGVFVVALFSTNTRNILIYFGSCVIGTLLIYSGLSVRALAAAAVALVAMFYGTIYGAIELAPGFFAGYFDIVSLLQRAQGVYVTVDQFVVNADSLMHVLFGFGYMQSVDFKFLPTTIFDNTELDIYIYAGTVGLVLYLILLFAFFDRAVKLWRATGSVVWLAAASLLIGTPLFSTLNICVDQPCFQFVFALIVGGSATFTAPSLRQLRGGNLADGRQTKSNQAWQFALEGG